MPKFRSFLAIELKDSLKDKVASIQNDFKSTEANIKYVNLNNMHFTLKFFGDISEKEAEEISSIVKNIIKNYKAFDIQLKGTGAFPNRNNIKVLWVGTSKNNTLSNLQKDLDNEFNKIGFKKERNYKSHLTIGRMKNAKSKDKVQKLLKKYEDYDLGSMEVNRIVLKKSTLTKQGPVYEDLEIFKVV